MGTKKASGAKAFHHVSGALVDDVIEEGKIVVGAMRLDPAIWYSDCPDRLHDLIAHAKDGGKRTVNEVSAQALLDLVGEAVEGLAEWQKNQGVVGISTRTDFQCLDFLAGDLGYVFMSVDDWISWGRSNPSGFVFDAEDLLRRGALLRIMDLGPRYYRAAQEVIVQPWRSIKAAKQAILDVLADVQKEGQLEGKEAIAFLRDTFESDTPLARPIEILWSGDLPLGLAEAAWKDGVEVPVGRVR